MVNLPLGTNSKYARYASWVRSMNTGRVQPARFSPPVSEAASRPRPEPRIAAPAGIGSSTTTQVMSVCASISSVTR